MKLFIDQNYFSYKKQLYLQNEGFVIGNLTSSILSKLCVQNYKATNMLHDKLYKMFIKYKYKYIKVYFRISDTLMTS